MKLTIAFFLTIVLSTTTLLGAVIHGSVTDVRTKEPLIGANVMIKETSTGVSVSLSGYFKLSLKTSGTYTISCSFIGYHSVEKVVEFRENQDLVLDFELEENTKELMEIVVRGEMDKTTDQFALHTEKNSQTIINVMSAKTIQLMPDITVANLLGRFSGVSVGRNSSGDGQFAIIRGMEQRYNYTLVNGVKIASPDNKQRYIPMDLFPAELLDRLEVIKTLTPSMEGDATGGAMNLVMKDAPSQFTITANAATGTNEIAVQRGFSTYSGWQDKAPVQMKGGDYVATPNDFSYQNFKYYNAAPVNQVYGFSIGDRLTKDEKLGLIVAGSYQDLYRAANSTFFKPDNQPNPNNVPAFDDILIRQYSTHQKRLGLHAKADYRFSNDHHLKLYGMFVELDEVQRRHTIDTSLSIGRNGLGTGATYLLDRSRVQQQNIFNTTLQGDHRFSSYFKLNWSAVYSKATNAVPDWSEYQTSQYVDHGNVLSPQVLYTFQRIWLANTDEDYTGAFNLTYSRDIKQTPVELAVGGLYRDKARDNTYYSYDLVPTTVAGLPPPFQNGITTLAADQWQFNGSGAAMGGTPNPNTYTSHEKIAAGYLQAKVTLPKSEWIGGVRAEHTYQDYLTTMPLSFPGRYGNTSYLDLLPSLHFKYKLDQKQNLRASYFKSINRPGFFELVPSKMPGDYFTESGNPYLKHATIDNLDVRYERFSKTLDQIMVGAFFKNLHNPIETIWRKDSASTSGSVIGPANLGNAQNFGVEFAVTKYWGRFGVAGNYTYTYSQITTPKLFITNSNTNIVVSQTRPLQGQSPHIANLSLLYKDGDRGFNLQLAMVYTGSRITLVSPFKDLDYWQQPLVTMDFSVEKKISQYFSFYAKVQNILNTPYQVYIQQANIYTKGPNQLPLQTDQSKILVQQEYYGRNIIAGIRYKFLK